MENKSFDKKISQVGDTIKNWKNKKEKVKSPALIKNFSNKIKEIYSKKRITPAIVVKNYNNIFEKAKFYAEQMKKIVEDAELSTHEKKGQVKVYVMGLVEDLKKDVRVIGVKVNKNVKNVEYSKFLKVLPYILIAIGTLILANPVLLNVLIKAVSLAFSGTGTIFTQANIALFLNSFKILFLELKTLEKILLVVSFLSVSLEEIPRFLSQSNYEKTISGNSLLALTKKGLTDMVVAQNRINRI